ncbi:hypothetical protein Cni_G23259 [Canna indica]|uniref:Uncharacterized protein n=1 Tax=Canna indica TaxID=4628 RepID=A0AAQ3KTP5_9LILI|nr:hypothetical protein Cni_G23259 [Canna indica]
MVCIADSRFGVLSQNVEEHLIAVGFSYVPLHSTFICCMEYRSRVSVDSGDHGDPSCLFASRSISAKVQHIHKPLRNYTDCHISLDVFYYCKLKVISSNLISHLLCTYLKSC